MEKHELIKKSSKAQRIFDFVNMASAYPYLSNMDKMTYVLSVRLGRGFGIIDIAMFVDNQLVGLIDVSRTTKTSSAVNLLKSPMKSHAKYKRFILKKELHADVKLIGLGLNNDPLTYKKAYDELFKLMAGD